MNQKAVTFINSQSLLKSNRINRFPKGKMKIKNFQIREVAPRTTVINFKWQVYPAGTGSAFHGIGSGIYILRTEKRMKMLEQET